MILKSKYSLMLIIPENVLSILPVNYSNIYCYNTVNVDIIKLDIQLCKSGDIIIYSDMFNKNQLFSELTFSEIFVINSHIVKLYDYLKDINKKTKIILEIKGVFLITNELNNIIDSIMNSHLFDLIISSYSKRHLDSISEHMIVKKGFITKNIFNLNNLISILNNLQYLFIEWSNLDYDTVIKCNSLGIKIIVFTVENSDQLNYVLKYNIDGIISTKMLHKSLI